MTTQKIYRETSLPSTLEPYAIYYIAPSSKPNYVEIYVTNSSGTQAKRVIQDTDVQSQIDSSISSLSSIQIVDNISQRNALNPTKNTHVYVIDASDDPTVSGGSASYLYRVSNATWYKFSESESLDLDLDLTVEWSEIVNKPSSTTAQIDSAVANSHTHSNKSSLDKIGESGGLLTYNNSLPKIGWDAIDW